MATASEDGIPAQIAKLEGLIAEGKWREAELEAKRLLERLGGDEPARIRVEALRNHAEAERVCSEAESGRQSRGEFKGAFKWALSKVDYALRTCPDLPTAVRLKKRYQDRIDRFEIAEEKSAIDTLQRKFDDCEPGAIRPEQAQLLSEIRDRLSKLKQRAPAENLESFWSWLEGREPSEPPPPPPPPPPPSPSQNAEPWEVARWKARIENLARNQDLLSAALVTEIGTLLGKDGDRLVEQSPALLRQAHADLRASLETRRRARLQAVPFGEGILDDALLAEVRTTCASFADIGDDRLDSEGVKAVRTLDELGVRWGEAGQTFASSILADYRVLSPTAKQSAERERLQERVRDAAKAEGPGRLADLRAELARIRSDDEKIQGRRKEVLQRLTAAFGALDQARRLEAKERTELQGLLRLLADTASTPTEAELDDGALCADELSRRLAGALRMAALEWKRVCDDIGAFLKECLDVGAAEKADLERRCATPPAATLIEHEVAVRDARQRLEDVRRAVEHRRGLREKIDTLRSEADELLRDVWLETDVGSKVEPPVLAEPAQEAAAARRELAEAQRAAARVEIDGSSIERLDQAITRAREQSKASAQAHGAELRRAQERKPRLEAERRALLERPREGPEVTRLREWQETRSLAVDSPASIRAFVQSVRTLEEAVTAVRTKLEQDRNRLVERGRAMLETGRAKLASASKRLRLPRVPAAVRHELARALHTLENALLDGAPDLVRLETAITDLEPVLGRIGRDHFAPVATVLALAVAAASAGYVTLPRSVSYHPGFRVETKVYHRASGQPREVSAVDRLRPGRYEVHYIDGSEEEQHEFAVSRWWPPPFAQIDAPASTETHLRRLSEKVLERLLDDKE